MDNNITMTIEEEEVETLGVNIAEVFEKFIPDDAKVITIKYQAPDIDEDDFIWSYKRAIVDRYLRDCGVEVLATAAGIHRNGKSQKTHIHYHIIAESFYPPSNPSQHRARWCKKNEESFTNFSFSYKDLDKTLPKYSILSYTLKESTPVKGDRKKSYTMDGKPMIDEMYNFLLDTGAAIYQKELGLAMRLEKCEERKQLALSALFQLCNSNKSNFNSFKSMMLWLDDNYIQGLELTEMPDPKNYKTNCQKIAVKLGFLKYSDI